MENQPLDATLKVPFNMVVCGPSQSGKTHWVGRLLLYAKHLFERPPKHIHWHSPHNHLPSLSSDSTVHTFTVLPWEVEDEEEEKPDLIVIDDFAQETANSKQLTTFLTQFSHHRGISIILLSQNLFWAGKEMRSQSLNTHYIILMRQSRDLRQVRTLGRQLTQTNNDFNHFIQAYNQATNERPFAYLLISIHPRDDKRILLRSNIFPEDASSATVYLIQQKV